MILDFLANKPAYIGIGLFVTLFGISLLWKWIRWDDSPHDPHPERAHEETR